MVPSVQNCVLEPYCSSLAVVEAWFSIKKLVDGLKSRNFIEGI